MVLADVAALGAIRVKGHFAIGLRDHRPMPLPNSLPWMESRHVLSRRHRLKLFPDFNLRFAAHFAAHPAHVTQCTSVAGRLELRG